MASFDGFSSWKLLGGVQVSGALVGAAMLPGSTKRNAAFTLLSAGVEHALWRGLTRGIGFVSPSVSRGVPAAAILVNTAMLGANANSYLFGSASASTATVEKETKANITGSQPYYIQ